MESDFIFKEEDDEGMDTLRAIEHAVKFNAWMFSSIRPYIRGSVLEIGSGIGNISTEVMKAGFSLTMSDIRENYCEFLRRKFSGAALSGGVIRMDLVHPEFEKEYAELFGSFDTVFALNVVEHIKEDYLALRNASTLLKPGGNLVILVPAYQWLYNRFDKELYHFRRYNRTKLKQIFLSAGMEVLQSFYFNAAGIPGWWLSGSVMKNRIIPARQMKLFNTMVPLFRVLDAALGKRAGLSVVCIGKKP
ncbi:MAG: class I SAM-dependent methyltransferase [Bacteroidia bacterium]|nr:class I SAM-dependent methyltransferase [Bacteroidia bacterium]